ncbi:MAG: AAA family ATPase [Acidimicrobiales bacterium]
MLPVPVDWHALVDREHRSEEWAIPSVLPAGRQATIWAKRKTGKSLLVVDLVAAVASGRPVLGEEVARPKSVIYCDYEMTEDDLEERVIDGLGYEPDELGNLHYYLLPTLPPLDDYHGGKALMALVERHQAEVVVIDTISRAIAGEENSADTIRAFYRCTGSLLKRAGVSVLRLDHGGKESDRGERGSSAKGDDVDLAWELREMGGNEYLLKRSYSRISWVPESLKLRRETEPLRHVLAGDTWPAGTSTCAEHLGRLGVDACATVAAAQAALKAAEVTPRRKEIVSAAQRFRRSDLGRRGDPSEAGNRPGNRPSESPWEPSPEPSGPES